ncbi:hypothetical protein KA005_53200 [bacterium]|nr:hypothetical protein [bacterium]
MKAIKQTKLSTLKTNGNCLAASVASLLNLDITDVPAFEDYFDRPDGDSAWHFPFMEFLESQGFEFVGAGHVDEINTYSPLDMDGYFIVSGISPRQLDDGKTTIHAVVYKNGEIAHDPHPSDDGITEPLHIYKIEKSTRKAG